jgi:hypothetical protein
MSTLLAESVVTSDTAFFTLFVIGQVLSGTLRL